MHILILISNFPYFCIYFIKYCKKFIIITFNNFVKMYLIEYLLIVYLYILLKIN